ncbi:MAG: PIG-L deacetylase family protein [Thermomicrobiales bacterium]
MHLFLAPHFDDVALFCGGEVARQVAAGEQVAIVTVFAGTPPAEMPLTPYAQWHLTAWGVASVAEALASRRAEDEAAAMALGAALVMLPFVDGAFREGRYRSWDELRTHLAPADALLPAAIASALMSRALIGPETVVTGPLAIGRHVDHQAVWAAMRLIAAQGVRVRGYEDYPYAADAEEYRARMAAPDLVGASPEVINIATWLNTKVRAIGCYPSQLSLLFPDVPMPEAVRAYGNLVAGGTGIAERFWWLDGESKE